MPVALHGYRNDFALVSGVPAGAQVVTAGVQKMAPGLKVAVAGAAPVEASLARLDKTQQVTRLTSSTSPNGRSSTAPWCSS